MTVFTFVTVWGPSNVKTVINVKEITNVKRITVIVFDSTRRLRADTNERQMWKSCLDCEGKTTNMRYILRHAVSKTNKINPLPTFRSQQIAFLSDFNVKTVITQQFCKKAWIWIYHYNNYPVWWVTSVQELLLLHVFWCPRQTQHLRFQTSFRLEDHTD